MKISLRIILLTKKLGILLFFLCFILFEGLSTQYKNASEHENNLQTDNSIPTFKVAYSSGIFRNVNLADAEAASKIFVQQIIKQTNTNYISKAFIIDDLVNNVDYIKNQELDVITMTGYEYLAIQNKIRLYPVAAPILSDSCLNKIIILVRKDSNINSIADLSDKKIKMESTTSGGNSNILGVWSKVLFYKNKINFNKMLNSQNINREQPLKTITSVFFKKLDAAIVVEDDYKTVVELNPQVGRELKILASSKPLLLAVVCYTEKEKKSKDFDLLKTTIYNLHETYAGKNFLKIFKMKKLVPFKNEFLTNITELFNDYAAIQSK
ncbi:MAG: PhnD/SsuA/transferrin family substrate-binding protein [Ignavibacteriales bacterium]|nr:PhnD/SsuA/transferrin family substrate-binding protein [Ignavibacteriales bacterium]